MKKSVKKVIKKNSGKNQGNKFLRNFIIIGVVVLILLFIFAMYSGKKEADKEDELASIWDIGILSSIGNFYESMMNSFGGSGGDLGGDEKSSGISGGGGGGSISSLEPCACCVGGACGSCNPNVPGGGCPPGTMMNAKDCPGCPKPPELECTADKPCEKVCVQTCINNKCKDTGKILCEDGKCVTDLSECKCKEECDPCLEVCNGISGNCEKRKGWYQCPSGECVVSPDLCSKCEPACKICEKCKFFDRDFPFEDEYKCTPDWELKNCGDGICVEKGKPCPQDCKPECTPCIQKCTDKGCEDTEMIWCSQDQSCRPKGFDCSVIK